MKQLKFLIFLKYSLKETLCLTLKMNQFFRPTNTITVMTISPNKYPYFTKILSYLLSFTTTIPNEIQWLNKHFCGKTK